MTPDQFTDWLSDLLEFYPDLKTLNEAQTQLIKDKINTVFNKVTPELNKQVPVMNFGKPSSPDLFEERVVSADCVSKTSPPAGQSPNIKYCGFLPLTLNENLVDNSLSGVPIKYQDYSC